MTIHVISIMWNEEFMLPHFLKHYEKVADQIFIVDDHSTDRTAEIAKAHPKVTYSKYGYNGFNEGEFSRTLEEYSRDYPVDWAVCVDGDEFITGLEDLEWQGKGILKTKGYMMIGKTGRLEDCKKIRMKSFDKPVVFTPRPDLRFDDGRHGVNLPTRDSNLELLHYKYPSREYYLERNMEAYPRIMNKKDMDYRIKKGLDWFDAHI